MTTQLRRGFRFEFEAPRGWTEEKEDGRLVYRGPRGEALTVSGLLLTGGGPSERAKEISDRLFDEAADSVNETASDPGLVVLRPLTKDEAIADCWTLHAETTDGKDLFAAAICKGSGSVLLVTLEGPNAPEALDEYDRFLKTVRAAPVH
jgi:hypothetical protein